MAEREKRHRHYDMGTPLDRMRRFRRWLYEQGGEVTFDQFMAESLYSPQAFYQQRVEISAIQTGQESFVTHAGNPIFVEAIFRSLWPYISNGNLQMTELAGGRGDFKRLFFDLAINHSLNLDYMSIDISQKLINLQHELGGQAIQASALQLPLPDGALSGVLFMNELLDALPFKVVRPSRAGDTFVGFEELGFQLSGYDVIPVWRKTHDPRIAAYWQRQLTVLRQSPLFDQAQFEKNLPIDRMFCFNLNEEAAIREFSRVMKEGVMVIVDYGGGAQHLADMKTGMYGTRVYPSQNNNHPEFLALDPYMKDITTDVNFSNVREVAKSLGWKVISYSTESNYLKQHLTDEELYNLRNLPDYHALKPFARIVFDQSLVGFKVLVLKKTGVGQDIISSTHAPKKTAQ